MNGIQLAILHAREEGTAWVFSPEAKPPDQYEKRRNEGNPGMPEGKDIKEGSEKG